MELIKNSKVDSLNFENNIKILTYNQRDLELNLLNNGAIISKNIYNTLVANSDIECGVYEGGFTIWEGSKNLINYLITENISFENASVLELGCGYGLPGIFSLMNNAESVCFQVSTIICNYFLKSFRILI